MGQKFVSGKLLDAKMSKILLDLAQGYSAKETANRNKVNVSVVNSAKTKHKSEIQILKAKSQFNGMLLAEYNSYKNVLNSDQRIDRMIEKFKTSGKADIIDIEKEKESVLVTTIDVEPQKQEEFIEEITVKKEKKYSSDGICYDDLLEDYCNINNTIRSICEKYSVSSSKLYALLADCCGSKDNIPYRRHRKGPTTILTDDQLIELIADYESGEDVILVKDILIKYNLTCAEMYDYLAKYYGTNEGAIKRVNRSNVYKEQVKEDTEKDMGRTTKKKKGSYKGNRHQYQKQLNKIKEVEIMDIEEKVNEEPLKESIDNSIDYIGKIFDFENIYRLVPSDTTVQAGLVAGRHNIPVSNYIYTDISDDNMCDYEWQYNTASAWLDANIKDGQTLVLYCTGIQSALSAVISACLNKKINLIEMHHNPLDGKYYSQEVLSFTESKISIWPFAKYDNSGIKFYAYNTTSEDIDSIVGEMYCLSLTEHSNYNNEFIKDKCRYIIFKPEDEDTLWEYYRKMINEIQSTADITRNSIMMSKMIITQDNATWGANISKGYNWK